MISGKRHLNIVALLLAITLVFGYAMPAFAQATPGGAISIGESSAQAPLRDSGDSGPGDESVKCACPTTDGVAITHLAECPFYAAPAQDCTCTEKCNPADAENGVEAVINADCPVCGSEDADLSLCQGAAATPPEDGAPVLLLAAAPISILALGDVTIDETNFPDVKFRAWLQNSANIGGAGSDSVLTTEEIAGIKQIYMSRQGIRDLTGIELFSSLTALQCSYNYNPFTVPKGLPKSLTHLFFIDNDLTVLPDLPSGLEVLNCSENKLAELPPLPATLRALDCSKNDLTALELSRLTSLNISSSTSFNASGQSAYIALLSNGAGGFEAAFDLNTPTFGATGISYAGGKLKSNSNTITETTFTVETGKTEATLSGTLNLSYPAAASIEINATNFPDAKFRAILKSADVWSGIEGRGKDGYLTPDEVAEITSLDLSNQGISDFTGIALFTALKSFGCRQNALVALPVLPDSLEVLLCDDNKLTTLPVLPSGLERLYCSGNDFTVLPALPDGLIGLDCSYNPLASPPTLPDSLEWLIYAGIGPMLLPAALPTTLTELDYSDNGLTTLDLSGLNSLYYLNCSDNNLTELDLSGLDDLSCLSCSGNRLTTLDLSVLSMLEELNCAGNMLTSLDVSSLNELKELDCSANWLTVLNVSGLGSLYNLNCAGNSLTTLDMSSLDALEGLNCSGNLLTALDLAGLGSLYELNCSSNHLTALDLSSFSTVGYFDLQADDQTPRLTLLGSDVTGYNIAIALNNTSVWATGISYAGGILKSASKTVTSTPFSVDTGLAGHALSGTLLLTYGGGSPGTAPAITTDSLPGGRVGSFYSRSFAATGDTPITWTIDSGSLPDGLALSNGGVISGTPAVRGTFTFTVKAVNSEGDDTQTFSIEITRSGGGSSGGGSGSSSSGTTIIIQPEKKPGQPVIAEFNAIPTMDKSGYTTATISEKSVADAIVKAQAEAKAQGKTANGIGIAINIDLPEASKLLEIVLPRATLKSLVDAGVRQFEINGVIVSLNLNLEALQEIQKQSTGNVTIILKQIQHLSEGAKKLIGTRPVYDITITYVKNGKSVSINSLNKGSVTLSIPYTPSQNEAAGYLFGVYVDGKGNASRIPGSIYDSNSRSIIFDTNHFSAYGVGYGAPSAKFTDISTHWAKESIDYVVGRGLFSGTTDTTFAPDTAMTRGMLVTTLGRLSGADVSFYKTSSFTDVKAASAFLPYIEWAYTKGIIHGIGNDMFAPDRLITREEIALILQNYATAAGYTFPVIRETISFADNNSIGSSYRDAVKAVQQAGIMIGENNNKFNPKDGATRAEAAAMLHRYIKLTIAPLNSTGLGEE